MPDFATKVIGAEWFQYILYMTLVALLAVASYSAVMMFVPGLMPDSVKEDVVEYIRHYTFG